MCERGTTELLSQSTLEECFFKRSFTSDRIKTINCAIYKKEQAQWGVLVKENNHRSLSVKWSSYNQPRN